MILDEYPHCCGARILHDFPRHAGDATVAVIKKGILARISGIHGRIVFAITNHNQTRVAEALRALGFRMVKRFTNENTGHQLRCWLKVPE